MRAASAQSLHLHNAARRRVVVDSAPGRLLRRVRAQSLHAPSVEIAAGPSEQVRVRLRVVEGEPGPFAGDVTTRTLSMRRLLRGQIGRNLQKMRMDATVQPITPGISSGPTERGLESTSPM